MEEKEKKAMQLIDDCNKCINDGTTDSFRSYEEGVKDALDWVYCGGDMPMIMLDNEEE